jgi:hypothetical protein
MEEEREWERQKKPYGAETQFFFLSNRYEYFIQLKRERARKKKRRSKYDEHTIIIWLFVWSIRRT